MSCLNNWLGVVLLISCLEDWLISQLVVQLSVDAIFY